MKTSMEVVVSSVHSNEALPASTKRKTPWQQSSPAISEDQLDFEIFAADPVRPQSNPSHCASSFTAALLAVHSGSIYHEDGQAVFGALVSRYRLWVTSRASHFHWHYAPRAAAGAQRV
jgi:hypothetical protein